MNRMMEVLLEKYIEGKDQDKYQVLEEIYLPNAKVKFEINSDQISFPDQITGNKNIARVLSAEFNQAYDHVRTYYLTGRIPQTENLIISGLSWLVLMREKKEGSIRVGAGVYDWIFERQSNEGLRIKQHNIHIGVMLSLPGLSLSFLQGLQGKLPYPWVDKEKAVRVLREYDALKAVHDYLRSCQRSI